jgi:hypothetical protein
VHEARVAVVALAVGEAELHDLGDEMDVGRRIVAERGEIVGGEQRQHLEQDRPLAPRAAGEHLDAAEAGRERALDLGMVVLQIARGEPAAVLGVVAHHGRRQVAAIEGIARRAKPGDPSAAARRALLVHHELQRAGEIRLDEQFALAGRPALGQEDGGIVRPAAIGLGVLRDVVGHHRMHGKALARIANGGARDVAEAHGPVALERQDPRVRRCRHHRAEDAQRDHAAVLAEESLEPRGPGPAAEPADDHRLVALGEVDDHGRHARALHLVAVDHAERDARGDPRVDGIAPGFEHGVARLGREVVPGRDHVTHARDHGLKGHRPTSRGGDTRDGAVPAP